MRIGPGALKRLHIDKAVMAARGSAPVRIRVRKLLAWEDHHASHVEIEGPSTFIYRPLAPLQPEGTYAWIETTSAVRFI